MSSRLKSLLTIGFVIVLIISFQKYGGRINQQILVTLQGCDGLYPSHCFYIYDMFKIPGCNNITSRQDRRRDMLAVIKTLFLQDTKINEFLCQFSI